MASTASAPPLPPTPSNTRASYSTLFSGRGLFVAPTKASGFTVGETVLRIERPLVAVPDDKNLEKCCSWCMKWVGDEDGPVGGMNSGGMYGDPEEQEKEQERVRLKKCTGCKVVWYCSPECQKLDWVHGPHKYECPIFVSLYPRILPVSVRCLVRLLLLHKYKGRKALSGRVGAGEKWWEEEVIPMEGHEGRYDPEMITLMSLAARKYSGTGLGEGMVRGLYCKTLLNSFAISTPLDEEAEHNHSNSPNFNSPTKSIGNLFDPLAALINHSCEPNCVLEFAGREVVVTCIRPVAVGEELTFSYIDVDEVGKGVRERRKELQERWFFWCKCARCVREDVGNTRVEIDEKARIVELE